MKYIDELIDRYPNLACCKEDVVKATNIFIDCYKKGGKLLICGNGGSAADSLHIVGELMKAFCKHRAIDEKIAKTLEKNEYFDNELIAQLEGSLPAISLCSESALLTATMNDRNSELVYAQGVLGYAKANDVLLCISTSGNSKNIVNAASVAKAMGIKVVSLTGSKDSKLSHLSDVTIKAPETETFKVQELHLPIYHAICLQIEETFFA